MGLVLLIAGLLMVITGARGTYAQFGSLVAGEFQGQNNFTYWFLSFMGLGAIGYIPKLQTVSRLLMTLVLLVLVLSHKGFFAQFTAALKAGPKQPNSLPSQTSVSPNASTATINSAITSNTTGPFGSTPSSAGQSKAFGWLNYFFGLSTNSSGSATP